MEELNYKRVYKIKSAIDTLRISNFIDSYEFQNSRVPFNLHDKNYYGLFIDKYSKFFYDQHISELIHIYEKENEVYLEINLSFRRIHNVDLSFYLNDESFKSIEVDANTIMDGICDLVILNTNLNINLKDDKEYFTTI